MGDRGEGERRQGSFLIYNTALSFLMFAILQDNDLIYPHKAGLVDCSTLPDMLIMGAILNPMFQNKVRMVKSGMCTEEQYEVKMLVVILIVQVVASQ